MFRYRRIVGSIAALFLVVGPGTGCEPDSVAPVPAIGDVTTLDPCGFIAPDAFADLKTVDAAITIEPGNFARCDLNLRLVGREGGPYRHVQRDVHAHRLSGRLAARI
ncbi:hypothetical protein NWFMUON74_41920 [Nocardia wallacei]|uniref:Uncharacterized protein n=1 Tax=Nocardia wallacei TaxID=480035 RepID=A0A7G1KMW9_9NOCA|nr:hypothetical protein NWFMUON74_41920 [Nocardia wallacei]